MLDYLPRSVTEGSRVRVIDSWVESEDVFCIIYRFPWLDELLGLRRGVEIDDDETFEEWAVEVGDLQLGEPLGTVTQLVAR